MNVVYRYFWLVPFFCLLCSAAFFSTGVMTETDNLKYLGIAFGMQDSGNYLVPMVNGVPYTDKPPLLFWLIVACWHVFGELSWAYLLLICIFVIAWIFLSKATYAALFPEDKRGQLLLPYVLVGSFAIIDYCHYIHVDLLLVTGVLLTNLGILRNKNSVLIVCGVVLGLLAKGPVIFVFTLLPYLLSVLLNKQYRCDWRKVLWAMLLGLGIVFCAWVIPVILNTDHEFLRQILYGQLLKRSVNHFDDKPLYFYLLKLPFILLPWSLNILFVKKFSDTFKNITKNHLFIVMIILVSVVVLSFFGQKRFWYLLPCVPYAMMIITRFISLYRYDRYVHSVNRMLLCLGMIGAILFSLVSPYLYEKEEKAFYIQGMQDAFAQRHDAGIAFFQQSSGDVFKFNYLARMSVIPVLQNTAQVEAWLLQHPHGLVVVSGKICPPQLNTLSVVFDGSYLLCGSWSINHNPSRL